MTQRALDLKIVLFHGISMAVVSNDYKYIYWPCAEELYDRHNDPLEMKNLVVIGSHQDKLMHYRDTYDHRLHMLRTNLFK